VYDSFFFILDTFQSDILYIYICSYLKVCEAVRIKDAHLGENIVVLYIAILEYIVPVCI
jgi:hypothetical protein